MDKRPRILHVYKDIYPPVMGGVEKHIHDVCVGLREQFDFTIMVAHDRAATVWTDIHGIPVCKVATWGRLASAPLCPGFPWNLSRLARGVDIVHYHVPNPTGELSHLLVRPKAAALATYHSDVVRQQWAMGLYGPFLRAFLRRMSVILPTTQRYVDSSPFLRDVRDKCKPIALGVNTAAYAATPEIALAAKRIRARYGNQPLIGFLGKLRAYKGLQYLIEALSDVEPHNTQLLIIGDGPMRREWEAIARQKGLERRVHFLGERPDEEVVAYLHAIDVFCLPSHLRSEAFGLAQVEAMACGKPVVSCNLDTGVPYVNLDGETGLVVAPATPWSMTAALNRLLNEPELKLRMGETARRRAVRDFDRALMLRRIAEVYRRLSRPQTL